MDGTYLMLMIVFGALGMGFVVYGKKMGQLMPIVAGVGLMVCPYFIYNTAILTIVCLALTAAPFVVRES